MLTETGDVMLKQLLTESWIFKHRSTVTCVSGLILALAAFTAVPGINAQAPEVAPQVAPQLSCKDDPRFRAFDFWSGTWDVLDQTSGQHAGRNTIRVIENGCALHESWAGNSGSTGTSLNYFNPVTGVWRQVWVSSGAYAVDIEGTAQPGRVRLTGDIWYYTPGTRLPFRGTWSLNSDGSVRQLFEQRNPTTQEWEIWFDGLYTACTIEQEGAAQC